MVKVKTSIFTCSENIPEEQELNELNEFIKTVKPLIVGNELREILVSQYVAGTKKAELPIISVSDYIRKYKNPIAWEGFIVLVIGEEQLEINLWAPWQYRLSLNTLWDNVIKRQPDMHSIPIGGGVFSKMLYDISEGYADDFIGKKIKNIAIRSEEENVFGSISIELESGKSIKIYEHDDEEFIEAG